MLNPQDNIKLEVENLVNFKIHYKAIVDKLVTIRKESGLNQESLAEWLNVGRTKVVEFESLKRIDVEFLLLYADKMSVDVRLNFEIN